MASESAENTRLHNIDWLRVLVILTLIPFHASLTYLRYGVVPIKAPVSGLSALPFLIVEVPLGDFIMAPLFFVAGVASWYSFGRRGAGRYVGERLQKLMLPFGLGFLLLCPVTAYIQAQYERYQGSFIDFIPRFFLCDTAHYHGYMHLWFLFYLFVFSVICVPLFARLQGDERRIRWIGTFHSQGNRLLVPFGLIVLLEIWLRLRYNTGSFTIVGDWANVSIYLSLFVFGYVYAASPPIQEKLQKYYPLSKVLGALSLAALYFVNVQSQMLYSDASFLGPTWVLAKGVYECSAIVFLLNFGRLHLNRESGLLGYLNKASFTIYIFHYLPVTFYTWLLIDLDVHILGKFLPVVALSYLTVIAVYELWQRAKSSLKHEAAVVRVMESR
ncbi:MAG: acyltransferase family protein [Anaerolineae bacterium]